MELRSRSLVALAAIVLLTLAAGCGGDDGSEGDGLAVVATYSIAADMVANVGGDDVAVTTLVGADRDVHTYEPVPSDSRAIAEAAVVIENGLEFEPFLDDLYDASGADAVRVELSEGVAPLAGEEDHAREDEDAHADEEAHEDGAVDPHIWQSAANARIMVANVRDALVAADPANEAGYRERADDYLAEIAALDAEIRAELAALPDDRRKLVTNHDTFGYFAREYGFQVIGVASGSVSTEAASPGAGALAELIRTVRAAGVPAIFAENVAQDDVIQAVARDADITVAPPLYTDSLGQAGTAGDSYLGMMRHNATTVAAALGGER